MDQGAVHADAVESPDQGVWTVDLDGHTLDASATIARMLGVAPSVLPSMRFQDAVDESTAREWSALVAAVREPDPAPQERALRLLRPDGQPVAARVRFLPLRAEDGTVPGLVLEVVTAPGPARSDAPRILVVEDNSVNQLVARGLLESLGYQVEVADDGVEALETLSGGGFAAVLMDLQMPRMDGYTTTGRIRAEEQPGQHLPIVAMTASVVEGERERCLSIGMDDFLTKPVDAQALAVTLARQLGQAAPVVRPRATTAPPSELDTTRLDMLRDLDGSDRSYLDRAIGNFLVNSRAAIDTLRDGVREQDAFAVRQCAHKLVGTALNLGVGAVGAAARDIEHLANDGGLDGAEEAVDRLEAVLTSGHLSLLQYQASYASS